MSNAGRYLSGFRNFFESEAEQGMLPVGRNSPQRPPGGLYAEQLSGTAFTAPRGANLRSWLYRIQPSVVQSPYERVRLGRIEADPAAPADPNQIRWDPMPLPSQPTDLLEGLFTVAVCGDAWAQSGATVYVYACNRSMDERFFYCADGEWLMVPQHGGLELRTEMGVLEVRPGEIALLPRGVKCQIRLLDDAARGYVCENHGGFFRLPDLGPIGANGLANPRDFLAPVAAYEERRGDFQLIAKYGGHLWACALDHSPLDVVAWHGNYHPCKYDLARFNAINTVSFDHPDPSIFTVLTAPSEQPGTANVDFVIFPPRWMVAEDTFRPPYFHRNVMSEFMGLVHGVYDAKAEGFEPGGASLHNCMSPHGPDTETFETASEAKLEPVYQGDTLAFMFESRYVFRPTAQALEADFRQTGYQDIWQGLRPQFKATRDRN